MTARASPAARSDRGGRDVAGLATQMRTRDDVHASAHATLDPTASACAGPKGVALAPPPSGIGFIDRAAAPIQRAVRTANGAQKIDEAPYAAQGAKAAAGTLFPVKDLIADNVQRTFDDVTEMETYADGGTDYIGDVKTASAGTYWYRLPKDQLMVLGETHHDKAGNVEDVIVGLRTSRFMYEPFAELVSVDALDIPFTSTKVRMGQADSAGKVAGLAGKAGFEPALENIVIKVLTAASIVRNEFVAGNPTQMDETAVKKWGSREKDRYSYGERAAHYLCTAIHLAADLAQHNFGDVGQGESALLTSQRALKKYYVDNQAVLDDFMNKKDADDLIGIYELTAPDTFKNLRVINDFTLPVHDYATRYIEALGHAAGNVALKKQGTDLAANTGATRDTLRPAREHIMWSKILHAKANNYLIVGMGDTHRGNLTKKLNRNGIAHEAVTVGLERQAKEVDSKWVK